MDVCFPTLGAPEHLNAQVLGVWHVPALVPRVFLCAAALAACALLSIAAPAPAQDQPKPENPVGPVSYTPWHFQPRPPEPKGGEPRPPEPQTSPAPYRGEALVLQQSYIGRDAAEPTMGVDKDGVAFYAAGEQAVPLGEGAGQAVVAS